MSSDLDLPLLPSAEQIRRREFATVRRGYDPDQVRDYLHHVSSQVETLEQELRETRMQTDTKASRADGDVHQDDDTSAAASGHPSFVAAPEAMPGDDGYGRLAERFTEMIRAADEQSTKVVEEAQAEAARSSKRLGPKPIVSAWTPRLAPKRRGRWATTSSSTRRKRPSASWGAWPTGERHS